MATLYERLDFLCKQKGIKGGRMCTDLGFSKSLMTDLKSGRKKGVNAETAQKLAAYFGVSVGYLLGNEKENDKKEQPIEIDELSTRQKYFIERIKKMSASELDRLEQILALVEKE